MLGACREGWAYPWAVRVRLADLLLRGLFDTLDEGAYIDQQLELLGMLEGRVWPLLGVTAQVHKTMYAWIHFRQVSLTAQIPELNFRL